MAFPLSAAEHLAIQDRIEAQEELIVAAAIRVDGVVVMAERPGRHGDCINFLYRDKRACEDQGFVTSHGRFVDRQEAAELVASTGQGSHRDMGPGYPAQLFSEDLWNEPAGREALRHAE